MNTRQNSSRYVNVVALLRLAALPSLAARALAGPPDFNGDGYADLALGVPLALDLVYLVCQGSPTGVQYSRSRDFRVEGAVSSKARSASSRAF